VSLTDLVRAVVDQVRPENIDPAAITVTSEGPEVEIVILAHRDLDGVSLVAWTDRRGARLLWAQVSDLSTHDDLDLGVVVESISAEGDWRPRLRDAIAAELRRPIRLRRRTGWFARPRVECSIVSGDGDRRIGVVSLPRNQEGSGTEMTTTLAGGPRPWFSVPPAITHAG
jgi:hypothetical protein